MLSAGIETTASTLIFAVHLLSSHPEKAAKLAAEIDSRPDSPNYASLQEDFPYTDAVLRETLRLFPPITAAIREANKDVNLAGHASAL